MDKVYAHECQSCSKYQSLALTKIGEFTQGLLSCYLLSNENTLLAAKHGDRSDRIVLPSLESQEIHQAGGHAAGQRKFGPLSPPRSDSGEEDKNHWHLRDGAQQYRRELPDSGRHR